MLQKIKAYSVCLISLAVLPTNVSIFVIKMFKGMTSMKKNSTQEKIVKVSNSWPYTMTLKSRMSSPAWDHSWQGKSIKFLFKVYQQERTHILQIKKRSQAGGSELSCRVHRGRSSWQVVLAFLKSNHLIFKSGTICGGFNVIREYQDHDTIFMRKMFWSILQSDVF